MLTVKKICGDNDGMMVTVSRKMAKILTVSRKMAKILTVSRKSHHLLRPSFPEKASATPPLPIPPPPTALSVLFRSIFIPNHSNSLQQKM